MVAFVLCVLGISVFDHVKFAEQRIGVHIDFEEDKLVIVEVEDPSPARSGGMHAGDALRKVGDHSLIELEDRLSALDEMNRYFDLYQDSETIPITVGRNGEVIDLSLTPGMAVDTSLYFNVLVVLAYLMIGFLAVRRGPGYLNAHLLFFFCFLIAFELALPVGYYIGFYIFIIVIWALLTGAQIGTELHLASSIPEPASWLKNHQWLVPAFYAAGLLFAALITVLFMVEQSSFRQSSVLSSQTASDVGVSLWALAILAILVTRAVTYPELEGRRQTGIVALGLLPWALYIWLTTWAPDLMGLQYFLLTESLVLLCFPLAILFVLWREGQHQERMLMNLAGQIQEATDEQEISELIDEDLSDAFHPQWVAVFGVDSRSGHLSMSHSSGSVGKEELAPSFVSLADLAKRKKVPFEPRSRHLKLLSNAETDWLTGQNARLVVPVPGKGRHLVGLILLGPKKSDEPYTNHNRKLLESLANHVGLALENLQLHSDISEGHRVKRQVLSRLEDQGLNVIAECPSCGRCYDSNQEICDIDGTKLTLPLPLERVVDDRYRIDRLIGKGGMGAVYEATDLRLGRRVALKVLLAEKFSSQDSIRRFEREARISARLNHPGIVATHDYGITATGGAFLVMDRLQGQTLQDILDKHRNLDPQTIADWFDQLLDALEAAHSQRVIHRDLKPSNVFIGRNSSGGSQVFLLDFGLARVVQSDVTQLKTLTTPGMMLGTLAYMAPEQLNDGELDERTDLYAVGVMVIEALTGSRPFKGESGHTLSLAILGEEYVLPGADDENAQLAKVLSRCLSKGQWERHAKVSELRRELIPAIREFVLPRKGSGPCGSENPTVQM